MADDLTAELIEARIQNHELTAGHGVMDESRIAALEAQLVRCEERIARLEGSEHRHDEYEGDETIEVVEEE